MTLIRWNPVRDIATCHPLNGFTGMQREMGRMMDQFRGDALDDEASKSLMPAVDIVEREKDFSINVDLPGVDKKDVKITVQNDILTIKGEKKKESEKKDENFHRLERCYGSFQRSFALPTSVDSAKIDASYDNGVLTVVIPKLEETKPKEIEVHVK